MKDLKCSDWNACSIELHLHALSIHTHAKPMYIGMYVTWAYLGFNLIRLKNNPSGHTHTHTLLKTHTLVLTS